MLYTSKRTVGELDLAELSLQGVILASSLGEIARVSLRGRLCETATRVAGQSSPHLREPLLGEQRRLPAGIRISGESAELLLSQLQHPRAAPAGRQGGAARESAQADRPIGSGHRVVEPVRCASGAPGLPAALRAGESQAGDRHEETTRWDTIEFKLD